ncbi:hypothetical protein F4803DRAFT_549119 [Xylaria telfairii]|nr:hypothetical protein F4803DRAFT_549119 [Xylaria telfairii]
MSIPRQQRNRARLYANIADLEGSRPVETFTNLENWSNRTTWFLETIPSQQLLSTGSNDIRYALLIIAAIKTGKCLPSPSPTVSSITAATCVSNNNDAPAPSTAVIQERVCDILETSVEDSDRPLAFNIMHPSGASYYAIEATTKKPVDAASPL